MGFLALGCEADYSPALALFPLSVALLSTLLVTLLFTLLLNGSTEYYHSVQSKKSMRVATLHGREFERAAAVGGGEIKQKIQ